MLSKVLQQTVCSCPSVSSAPGHGAECPVSGMWAQIADSNVIVWGEEEERDH